MQVRPFSLSRQEFLYLIVFELHQERKFSILKLCVAVGVSRSAYYKWLKHLPSKSERESEKLAEEIKRIFEASHQIYGVKRMKWAVYRELNQVVNVKRIRRLMRLMGLQSEIRRKKPNWIRTKPLHTAENIINRDFEATTPNQKWFTDVSYLFYGQHETAYISAIIDRYDLSIVSYKVSQKNDNQLVLDTLKEAMEKNPGATPIIQSDRGFQYTSNEYQGLKKKLGFEISMSRVNKCLDNQPIESFWGTLKAEYYYRHKFETYDILQRGLDKYIDFYLNKRYVPKFKGLTPNEYRALAA
jgi:putative transposase